jgi:hypothetical protein
MEGAYPTPACYSSHHISDALVDQDQAVKDFLISCRDVTLFHVLEVHRSIVRARDVGYDEEVHAIISVLCDFRLVYLLLYGPSI